MYAKLGMKVTVVEMMYQLLPGFDHDVVKIIARRLKKDGVEAFIQTKALGWEATEKGRPRPG